MVYDNNIVQCSIVYYSMVMYGAVQYSIVWYGTISQVHGGGTRRMWQDTKKQKLRAEIERRELHLPRGEQA